MCLHKHSILTLTTFWGLEIGVSMPPKLQLKARQSRRARANGESRLPSRRTGNTYDEECYEGFGN